MRFLLTISFILVSFIFNGQKNFKADSIKSFEWSHKIRYLPSSSFKEETYKYRLGKISHNYIYYKDLRYFNLPLIRLFTSKRKKKVLNSLKFYLDIQKANKIEIYLTKDDQDKLLQMAKNGSRFYFPPYSANYNDVKKHISGKESITINFDEFNTDYSKYLSSMSVGIDGSPFNFHLIIKRKNDTVYNYKFNGYVDDKFVEDTGVKDYLIFYYIYNDFDLFRYTEIRDYFNKEQVYFIILRYISYIEGRVNRNDYKDL